MLEVKAPPVKQFTQKQKILLLMCQQPKKWFYPYEFMKPGLGPLYVGYKAPTRIAEMQHDVPMLFEKKSEDKYLQRRLNVNEIDIWYDLLKSELREIIDKYYDHTS